jgi:hypothetical protein
MKTFFLILVIAWLPGILSSQNQFTLNVSTKKSFSREQGEFKLQFHTGVTGITRIAELKSSSHLTVYDNCIPATYIFPSLAGYKIKIRDLNEFTGSSPQDKEKINKENDISHFISPDSGYYNELLEESNCTDRIITIAGVYLLTNVNYSIAGNTRKEE